MTPVVALQGLGRSSPVDAATRAPAPDVVAAFMHTLPFALSSDLLKIG